MIRAKAIGERAYKIMGHVDIPIWEKLSDDKWLFTCPRCGKWVMANYNPAPNEIDVGGPAVALACNDKEN